MQPRIFLPILENLPPVLNANPFARGAGTGGYGSDGSGWRIKRKQGNEGMGERGLERIERGKEGQTGGLLPSFSFRNGTW